MKISRIFINTLLFLSLPPFFTCILAAANSSGPFVSVQFNQTFKTKRELYWVSAKKIGDYTQEAYYLNHTSAKLDPLSLPISLGYDFKYISVMLTYKQGNYHFDALNKHSLVGTNDKINGTTTSHSLMLDFALKIPNRTILTPYVGIGVGRAKESTKFQGDSNTAVMNGNGLISALFGGLEIGITRLLILAFDYRIKTLADASTITMYPTLGVNLAEFYEFQHSSHQAWGIKLKLII
ncbi:hypothetical protein ABSA28_00947 [Candidatus Hepatincolaceae symbiont of Richtersius coronifer]